MKWPIEVFIALRYLRPRRTFVSVITVLSVLGVTLAVMVLIVVLSVMAGFEKDLRDKIIGFNAHLSVAEGGPMPDYAALLDKIGREPGVVAAAPYVSGPVVAEFLAHDSGPVLRGIDPEAEEKVLPVANTIIAGELELRGDSVVVGDEWARYNHAMVGDKITIYGPHQLHSLRALRDPHAPKDLVLPTELEITGIFRTGLYDYDLNFFITSLENAQYLYDVPGAVHGISVRVADPLKVDAVKARLERDLGPGVMVRTWQDQNRSLFTAIATERVAMAFILFFIMIVAAFGLCSTLITITVQKAREIGVLKALGAGDFQILGIFVTHGLIVGLIGAASGVVLAGVVLYYRNPFRDLLSQRFGIDVFSADVYNFAQIPAEVSLGQVAAIAGSAVVICMLAALIPAQGAARLEPVKALRYE